MATTPGLISLGTVYATSSDTAVKLDALQVSGEEGVGLCKKPSSVIQTHSSTFDPYLYTVLVSLSTVHQFHMSLSPSDQCSIHPHIL